MLLLFDVQSFQFPNHLVRTYLYPSGGGSYGKGPICFKRTSLSLSIWCLAGTGDDVWFGCVINRLCFRKRLDYTGRTALSSELVIFLVRVIWDPINRSYLVKILIGKFVPV